MTGPAPQNNCRSGRGYPSLGNQPLSPASRPRSILRGGTRLAIFPMGWIILTMSKQATVLLSGGIDSMACAYFLRGREFEVRGLFIDYRHAAAKRERRAAEKVAARLGVHLDIASLSLPPSFGVGEIAGRNGLFALAALMGGPRDSQLISMGIHAGTPYYDCSVAFAERIDALLQEYTAGRTRFFAPFLNWAKPEIYEYCRTQKLDLSRTYSCETGASPPCGLCMSCKDRELLDVR